MSRFPAAGAARGGEINVVARRKRNRKEEIVESVKDAEQISNIAFGFMASKALFVALHLNVFTNLSESSKTAKQLAEEAGVPENRMTTILTALTAIGLLT